MTTVIKHPELPDYFSVDPSALSDVRSIVQPYEAGAVVVFPNLDLPIDFDFWAGLPADDDPSLMKLRVEGEDGRITGATPDLTDGMVADINRHMARLYDGLMDGYRRMFEPYVFLRKIGTLRLNRAVGRTMHIDSYSQALTTHFARLFINLDTQPRIWHTSHTAQGAFAKVRGQFSREEHANMAPADWWNALRYRTFGGFDAEVGFDNEPRHICVFEPGEAWAVDSRQVAHQIFYGRRCLTVDFIVDTASMLDPGRHYLSLVDQMRTEALGAADLS